MTPEEKVIALEAGMEMLKAEARQARDDRDAAIIENAQLKNRLNAYSTVLNEFRVHMEGPACEFCPDTITRFTRLMAEVGIKGEEDGN